MNPAAPCVTQSLTQSVIYPPESGAIGKTMLALLGVLWVLLLVVTTGQPGSSASTGLAVLLACAATALALLASYHVRVLADALRVLAAQRAPDILWQAWGRRTLASLTRYWALLCAATAVQCLLPGSSTSWLAAPALLSMVLCVAVLRNLARNGLAASGWAWAADAAVAALVLLAAFGPGFGTVALGFAELPLAMLLACALAWPAIAWLLRRRCRGALPVRRADMRKRVAWKDGRIYRFLKRYTVLDWEQTAPGKVEPPFNFSGIVIRLFNVELVSYFFLLQILPGQWGGTATPVRVMGLYIFCWLAASRLAVRDLQPRSLMLPGGLYRHRLGEHIVRSTLTLQLLAATVAALAYVLFQLAVGTAPAALIQKISGSLILVPELVFATSAAVALRASATRRWMNMAGTGSLLIGAVWPIYASRVPNVGIWTMGWTYLAVLLAGAAALTMLANRRWTVEKLFREIR